MTATAQDRYYDYMSAFNDYRVKNPSQREGQAHFNVLFFGGFDPDFANSLRGTDIDPFYVDAVLPAYFAALKAHWGVPT